MENVFILFYENYSKEVLNYLKIRAICFPSLFWTEKNLNQALQCSNVSL